jgi:hypothetical protein
MKNCPKCGKSYDDDSLNLCLDDGDWLVFQAKSEGRRRSFRRPEAAQNKFVSPYEIARIYAGLRDKEAAFANLEKAFELRDDNLTRLRIDFCMDNIRSYPRFSDLMKRVGLM